MPRRFLRVIAVAIAATPLESPLSQTPGRADGVTVTYLANEGVMLSAGNKKVIIDGLFQHYGRKYAMPADSTQVALRTARPPFDAVDLLLVTHRHGDHFHPAPVVAHLLANPRATLLTSRQVIDSLRGRLPTGSDLAARLQARTVAPGARRSEVVNGINVEILGLAHARIEHFGYIVDIGGRRVLHVGDTDDAESAFPPFRLDTARIDVALLPNWMLTSAAGRRVIERWIRPKQVVAIHMSARADEDRATREIERAWPGSVAFVRSLDTRRW